MDIYGWVLTLTCPLPAVIIFLYRLKHVLSPIRKMVFSISLYALTILTQFLAALMQLVHSEVSVVVLGVIASAVYAFYLGTFLKHRQLSHYPRASKTKMESLSESVNVIRERGPMPKWLGGLLATIIGGVILWWLTQSGLAPLKGGPDLKITAFRLPEAIYAGERVYAEITVYNEGGRTAEGCRLTWYTLGSPSPDGSEGTFGVAPQQSAKGKAWIFFKEAGEILTKYGITGCAHGISPGGRSWYPERKVHVLNSR